MTIQTITFSAPTLDRMCAKGHGLYLAMLSNELAKFGVDAFCDGDQWRLNAPGTITVRFDVDSSCTFTVNTPDVLSGATDTQPDARLLGELKHAEAPVMPNWSVSCRDDNGQTWLSLKGPSYAASISCRVATENGVTIASQVAHAFADDFNAAQVAPAITLPADTPIRHASNAWIRQKVYEGERAQACQLPYLPRATIGELIFHLAYQTQEASSLRREAERHADLLIATTTDVASLRAELDALILERVEADAHLERVERALVVAIATQKW